MFDIMLALAAAQSEYRARQGGHTLPEFSRSEGIRFGAGLLVLALVYAGLSLASASLRSQPEQAEAQPVGAVSVLGHL